MLSDKERGQIEAFRQANYSIREIGKELNWSKTIVWNYLKAPEEYGTKNNHGRPKKLTVLHQRLLVNFQQIKLEVKLIWKFVNVQC